MGSFRTKFFFREKLLKVVNLLYNATEWVRILETIKKYFFLSKIFCFFFWKKMTFAKTAKDRKFVVGCNWVSRISQNVDEVVSSWKKKFGFSEKKLWVFLQTAKSSQFDAESNRL